MAPVVKRAIEAVDAVISDTSVSPATTRARLEEVVERCQSQIDALRLKDDDGGDVE